MTSASQTAAAQADQRPLLPHHREELRRSGLSDETISACGFFSEDNYAKLAALLNREKLPSKKLSPSLVFPFRGPDGMNGYCRLKPDTPRRVKGNAVKYESPVGRSNEVFIPPRTFAVIDKPEIPLLVTEGEKKSAKADQEGFPCLGLVGVFGWKTGESERLLPALGRVAWKGREVYIVFDSDIAIKPEVADAEARLAAQLASRGAKVWVVRIPNATDGSRQGLDDFLIAAGPDALRQLMREAKPPRSIDPALSKVLASLLDPATEAGRLLTKTKRDGVFRLRYWRGNFYLWRRGCYNEVESESIRGEVIRQLNKYTRQLTATVVNNIIDQTKAQAAVPWKVDAPTWLGEPGPWPAVETLAARNGVFHLLGIAAGNANSCMPATPKLFSTVALNYDVALDAPKPELWLQFLAELWGDDAPSIDALQEWFGYLLAPGTSQQKILFLVGPKRSGKGTVARIIRALVGPSNVAGPTLAMMALPFGLWPLLDKSVAIVPDARLSGRSDRAIVVERLLSISGEDCLTVDRKHLPPLTVKLPTRLILLSNEIPRLSDASGALASRMILLRLTRSWYGSEDTELTKKLLAELPGILLWSIGGWKRLRDRGHFVQPPSGAELVGEMEDLASPISAFIKSRCVVGPENRVPRDELFQAFSEWTKEQGKTSCPDVGGFGRDLRAAVPTIGDSQPRIDGKKVRVYVGIRLKGATELGF